MDHSSELGSLARLLELSAEVIRRIADGRTESRAEIGDCADQIQEVADLLHDIVKNDGNRSDDGPSIIQS